MAVAVLFLLVVAAAGLSVCFVGEFERGAVFRGRGIVRVVGPGLRIAMPFVERIERVSVRPIHFEPELDVRFDRETAPRRLSVCVVLRIADARVAAGWGRDLGESPPPEANAVPGWQRHLRLACDEVEAEAVRVLTGLRFEDLEPKREELEGRACDRMNVSVERYGVVVDRVDFSPAFAAT